MNNTNRPINLFSMAALAEIAKTEEKNVTAVKEGALPLGKIRIDFFWKNEKYY